jgi:hypothetical protein
MLIPKEVSVTRVQLLEKRQQLLKRQIADSLDLLIGSIGRSPTMRGYNLTTKVAGKTFTRYVRKDLLPQAREMTRRYQKLWRLLRQLSRVNWQLLQRQDRDR